jgi:tRNA dimethylallyltransferase
MIIVTGPTGVGKSDLALDLARWLNGEIINIDMGQCYTPLTIGTAKPDWRTLPVPHHLFDCIDEPVAMNVIDFYQRVHSCIQDIKHRQRVPILVGGSGFYIHSLFFPPLRHVVTPKNVYEQPTHVLWQQLYTIDPERARMIAPGDRYRITRALDIWRTHAVIPSRFKPRFDPVDMPAALLVVVRERDELHARINQRVATMMAAGWCDEVAHLPIAWQEFLLKKKIIGYDDIIHALNAGSFTDSYQDMLTTIARKTRAYAKRQMTFNRMMIKKVEEHADSVYTELVTVSGDCYEAVTHRLSKILKKRGYGVE